MKRSLWRKLLVIGLAILTVATAFFAVRNLLPAMEDSEMVISTPFSVTITPLEDSDAEFAYWCEIKGTVQNISAIKSKKPLLLSVTVKSADSSEVRRISFPNKAIKPGESVELEESFPTNVEYTKITYAELTFPSSGRTYVLLGTEPTKKLEPYIVALLAMSVILFGLFIYSCVALYKSPKKKVHHRHHHHHHHHHHSEHSSSENG